MQASQGEAVLVTGSAGRLGRAAVTALAAAGFQVRGFDRVPTPGTENFVVANLTDLDALRAAARGARALIHLGATPDDDDFMGQLLPNNLIGLYNAFEAARLESVPRFILASTGQVNWWPQIEERLPVRPTDPPEPKHWYAVLKVAAEAAGQAYARNFGLTVLAVRLGWCPRTRAQADEIAGLERGRNTYLSPGDAGRFFVRAVQADLPAGYHIVYVASRPVNKVFYDLEPARALLGWEPRDQWPQDACAGLE